MHQHCRPSQRGLVSATLRELFQAENGEQARERTGQVIERLEPTVPKVCRLLEDAEADLLAFYAFPGEHWSKLRSTNPLERVNREIGRRSDVVGIFPSDASAIRLAGALLIEQNDEWLVCRRYLSAESITLLDEKWKAGFRAERRLGDGTVRLTPPSTRTIRKYLINLNGIFRRAREAYGISPNPVADVKRPGRVKARRTLGSNDFLEPTEVHALLAAAEDDIDAAIFATAAFCGLRLGELLALRWRAVDFPRSLISVEASFTRGREETPKSGDGRTVPMAPEVAAALRGLRERPYLLGQRDLVFIGRGGSHVDPNALRRRFHEALERAGLPRIRLHDLRHTFGTIMVSRVDPRTLQHWMGHGSIEVTEMYMAFRDRAEDAAKVSDAFRVA
jgi:integrase